MNNMILNAIFCTISGMVSGMGLGGGAILIMYLTSLAGIEQIKAQSISLVLFVPIAWVSIFIYSRKRMIKWKLITYMCVAGTVGSIVGSLFLRNINSWILSKIFGVFLLIMGAIMFFKK
ncbi:MAG: sulfite exporter TauE/SafE family protein [Candidatus Improbicoccus devescovinae]|nr:MAG: sulfite exporter TauE/SafE family protein [Candidatus Improbicoccus devescovinae]